MCDHVSNTIDMAEVTCFDQISVLFGRRKSSKVVDPYENFVIMELYIKAGKVDGEVGDCPFAHYVRGVLQHKNVEYNVRPCKPDSKPSWLVNDLDGRMPCLKQGDLQMVSRLPTLIFQAKILMTLVCHRRKVVKL